ALRALLAGVRVARIVRGAGRGHRREIHHPPRPQARALLDRRSRRGACRLRVLRQEVQDRRETSPPARRAAGARPRRWLATRRRVHPFRARSGIRELTLWTNDVLVAARRIYERAGFELVESERHRSFGKALVGQNWV